MEPKYTDSKRTEEVRDIVDRMPEKFGNWVAIAVLLFTVFILTAGYIIRYPDTVTGQITINSGSSPVKLVANTSGRLHLFHPEPRDTIKQNEYVAIIQNAADTEDVKRISERIRNFHPTAGSRLPFKDYFPDNVSLGDLNLTYFAFFSALKNCCNYENSNEFEKQREYLADYLKWQKLLAGQTQQEIKIYKEKLDIAGKWLHRNAALQAKDMIPEFEFDKIRENYLNTMSSCQSLEKTATTINIQLSDAQNKLEQINIQQHERENELHLNLLSAYQELTDNLKVWEERYVFKAPFDGRVEFLKFWTNGQFVLSGEEIFSIIPGKTDIIGQVILPARGAGKIKIQDDVIIKLENFPYTEFGSVEGKVASISLVAGEQKASQNSGDAYLVTVALPHALTTNYGKTLPFQHALKGSADIVVKKRRLIERLFDNLRYSTKE